MKFDEFYSKLPNPIDSDEILMEIINTYSQTYLGLEEEFYSNLVKTVPRSESDKINIRDKHTFHVLIFNKIKNSIKNLTKEKYIELTKYGHGNSLLKLRKELLNVEDAKTLDEVNQIMNKIAQTGLEKTLKYYFAGVVASSSWQHVSFHNTSGKLENYDKVEHRLYLNVARQDIYKLATILVEKMYKYSFPFYFKFDPKASRDDTLVIYSSSEHFLDNLEILKEVEQEYPEIVSRCKRPTILSGQIKKWIGYGSEPLDDKEDSQSFNSKRTPIIIDSIKHEWKKFIINNRKTKVVANNSEITFEELISNFCADKLFERMKEKFDKFKGTEEEFKNKYGYSKKELESTRIPQIIRGIFKTQLPKIIDAYINNSLNQEIKINTKNHNNPIIYSVYDFNKDIRKLLPNIIQFSPILLKNIRQNIKDEALKNGINPDKFCFDVHAEQILKNFLIKLEKAKTPPLLSPTQRKKEEQKVIEEQPKEEKQEQPTKVPENTAVFAKKENKKESIVESIIKAKEKKEQQDKIISQKPKSDTPMIEELQQEKNEKVEENNKQISIKRYSNDQLEKADLKMLISQLNPLNMKSKMKLPNGTTMGLVDYLNLIVFPHLPENGVIILEDGMPMPIIQFIEHGVLGECQERYNGNFPAYLYEKTRTNCGVLKLKNNGREIDIPVEDIPEYVNQTLLIRPLELPNNEKISTPEYLKDYYASHIPYNGIVTLTNGTKITAPKYIEEVLLTSLENKYDGNLPLLLFETTRQNNGTIDLNLNNFHRNYENMRPIGDKLRNKPSTR